MAVVVPQMTQMDSNGFFSSLLLFHSSHSSQVLVMSSWFVHSLSSIVRQVQPLRIFVFAVWFTTNATFYLREFADTASILACQVSSWFRWPGGHPVVVGFLRWLSLESCLADLCQCFTEIGV